MTRYDVTVDSLSLSEADYHQLLYEVYGLTCPPAFGTRRDFTRKTYGPRVAQVAKSLRTPFMPHQQLIADIAGEVDPDTGLLAHRFVDITIPRQSGKTTLVLSEAIHRARAWPRQQIRYAAQTGVAARQKWEDEHVTALKACKALRGKFRVRLAAGREAIIWDNGSMHGLLAGKETSGHGVAGLDAAFLDEYFAQIDLRLDQACGPAMLTKPSAQKWRLSTSGTSKSVPFNMMRARGRAAVKARRRGATAFLDWTAPPGADRTDRQVWRNVMPAMCPAPVRGRCRCSPDWRHTTTEREILAELEETFADALEEFDRAYMNISREDGETELDPHVPSLAEWQLLVDEESQRGPVVALAIDITPKRDSAAIVAAGYTPDGVPRIVVLETGDGTGWLMEAIVRLNAELRPVAWVLDETGPAATLIDPLSTKRPGRPWVIKRMEPRGTPRRGQLWIPTTREYGIACANFTDTVRSGALVHLGQPEMDIAVDGAKARSIGDGLYGFGRKIATANIAPLVGAALALAALEKFGHLATAQRITIPGRAAAASAPAGAGNLFRPAERLPI